MIDCAADFISSLKVDTSHNFLDLFNGLTLKILCKTAMGYDIDFENEDARQYREVIILKYICLTVLGRQHSTRCSVFLRCSSSTFAIMFVVLHHVVPEK